MNTDSSPQWAQPFVPEWVCSIGLPLPEFRAYMQICMRDGGGGCHESMESMASACQMCESVMRKTLQSLERKGMIVAHRRAGQTTVYTRVTTYTPPVSPDTPHAVNPCHQVHHTPPTTYTPPVSPDTPKLIKRTNQINSGDGALPSVALDASLSESSDGVTQSHEREVKPKRAVFTKPTPEELIEVCLSSGGTKSQARAIWNYYESNGWKVGRNPMKDWRAAVRSWLARDESRTITNTKKEVLKPMSEVIAGLSL